MKSVTATRVECENGTIIDKIDYLIFGTGTGYDTQFIPHQVTNPTSKKTVLVQGNSLDDVLQHNDMVSKCDSVAFIGGGPVSIELACEIAVRYPNKKKITMISSTKQLLPGFSTSAHENQLQVLQNYKVHVILGDRAKQFQDDTIHVRCTF